MAVIPSGRRRKVELTVLTDKSGSDTAQVVSVGATAEVYLAGTTVRSATGSPVSALGSTIPISSPGMIEVGDVLQNGTASSPTFTVTAINRVEVGSKYTWTLTGNPSASFSFAADDRLINTSRRPTIYKEAGDDISWGGSSTTSTSAGLVRFYTKARAVDVIVSGGTPSVAATVVRDVPAGDEGITINVQDYGGSITAAYEALLDQSAGDGGVLYIPQGYYAIDTAAMPITIDDSVHIRGDGIGVTRLVYSGTGGVENTDVLRLENSYCSVSDLTIQNLGATVGTGVGIKIGDSGGVTKGFVRIKNVQILDAPSYGIHIGQVSGGIGAYDVITIDQCEIAGSESGAQIKIGAATTMVTISNSRVSAVSPSGSNSPSGVELFQIAAAANVLIVNCDGLPASLTTNAINCVPESAYTNPKDGAANIVIDNCDFEYSAQATVESTPLIYIQGASCPVVKNCLLNKFGSAIHFEDCYAPVTENNTITDMGGSGYHVKITDTFNYCDRSSIYAYPDAAPDNGKRAPITVTTAGANPGWSMIGAGFKIPQYADDTERDTAPAAGADDKRAMTAAGTLIYVVTPTSPTSHLQIRHGGAWVGVGEQDGTPI